MEMSWLETVRLLGLDLQFAAIAFLLVLVLLEKSVARAWETWRAGRTSRASESTSRYPDPGRAVKLGA